MADDMAQMMKLAAYSKMSMISLQEIQTLVWLIPPGELAKHAVLKGMKLIMSDAAQMMFICFFFFL